MGWTLDDEAMEQLIQRAMKRVRGQRRGQQMSNSAPRCPDCPDGGDVVLDPTGCWHCIDCDSDLPLSEHSSPDTVAKYLTLRGFAEGPGAADTRVLTRGDVMLVVPRSQRDRNYRKMVRDIISYLSAEGEAT